MGSDQVIAVCVSGLARPGYKKALEIARKVFPYDFFYMHWKDYDPPEVEDCRFFDEPSYNYHNLLETKYKPDCHIWRRYTRPTTGKIFRKPGLLEKTRHNSKQTLAHYWLTKSLPEKYTTIISKCFSFSLFRWSRAKHIRWINRKFCYKKYLTAWLWRLCYSQRQSDFY